MRYPNFYIVGLPKAGTTSLHSSLIQHSQIYGSEKYKDYMFFGEDERIAHLPKMLDNFKDEKYILDTGSTYSYSREALLRIKDKAPNAKILLVVRDPVERTLSDFYFRRKLGRISITEKDVLQSEDRKKALGVIFKLSCFGEQLQCMYKIFKAENIKVILFEEITSNNSSVLSDIFDFLHLENQMIRIPHKNITGRSLIPSVTRLIRGRSKFKRVIKRIWPEKLSFFTNYLIKLNTMKKPGERELDIMKDEMTEWFVDDMNLAKEIAGIDFPARYKH